MQNPVLDRTWTSGGLAGLDQDPVFLNAPYSDTVPEGTVEGVEIFSVQVQDGDMGVPRPIQLSLEGDRLCYFQLQPAQVSENGVIRAALSTTATTFDREHPDILREGGLYAFKIRSREVIDPGVYNDHQRGVTVVVTDVSNRNSFTVPVPEDVAPTPRCPA